MRTFLLKLGLFLLPAVMVMVGIGRYEVSREAAYRYIEGDCYAHGNWIHDRIFRNDAPIDVAFLGSSHSIHAIHDRAIEDTLQQAHGLHLRVANLGYCRLGLNLPYVLLRDLLRRKRPKLIVIEIRAHEDRYSHPMFPFLAESRDVFAPPLWFNRDIATDATDAWLMRFEHSRRHYLGLTTASLPPDTLAYGFGHTDQIAATADLQAAANSQKTHLDTLPTSAFYMRYPLQYLQKIKALATSHGAKLAFVYLPEFAPTHPRAADEAHYRPYGPIWSPPMSPFRDPSLWMDAAHMNTAGATTLTPWLAQHIAEALN